MGDSPDCSLPLSSSELTQDGLAGESRRPPESCPPAREGTQDDAEPTNTSRHLVVVDTSGP